MTEKKKLRKTEKVFFHHTEDAPEQDHSPKIASAVLVDERRRSAQIRKDARILNSVTSFGVTGAATLPMCTGVRSRNERNGAQNAQVMGPVEVLVQRVCRAADAIAEHLYPGLGR